MLGKFSHGFLKIVLLAFGFVVLFASREIKGDSLPKSNRSRKEAKTDLEANEEGKFCIKRFEITGNTFFETAFLRSLVQSDIKSSLEADNCVVILVEHYRHKGFLDVRVSHQLEKKEGCFVAIQFQIKEGQRYKIKQVDAMVETKADVATEKAIKAMVRRGIHLQAGDFYDEEKIRTDLQRVVDEIGRTGRQACGKKEVYLSSEMGMVKIVYEIEVKGPPLRVGKIIIVGNKKTPSKVILDQLPFKPGKILRFPELRIAEKNLTKLKLFEVDPENGIPPTITVLEPLEPREESAPVRDLLVRVCEKSEPTRIMLGFKLSGKGFSPATIKFIFQLIFQPPGQKAIVLRAPLPPCCFLSLSPTTRKWVGIPSTFLEIFQAFEK